MSTGRQPMSWAATYVLGLLWLATFITYAERIAFDVLISNAGRHGLVSEADKGRVFAGYLIGFALTNVPGGAIAKRFGGKRALALAALLVALSEIPLLVILLGESGAPIPVVPILVSRVATGLVHGLVFPAVHDELSAVKRAHSLSTATVVTVANGMYLGGAVAMATTPLLIAHAGPAAVVIFFAALNLAWFAAAALCCCARTAGAEPGASAAGTAKGGEGNWASRDVPQLRRILQHSASLSILVCTIAFSASVFSIMSWLPTFASRALRVELAQLPAAARAAPYIFMYTSVLLGGRCADALQALCGVRRARVLVTAIGNAAAAAVLLCLPLQGRPTASFALLSFALAAATFSRAGYAVNHLETAGAHAGFVLGVNKTAGILVGAAASFAVGKQIEGSAGDSPAVWRLLFRTAAAGLSAAALVYSQCARGDELFPPEAKAGARDAEGGEYSSIEAEVSDYTLTSSVDSDESDN